MIWLVKCTVTLYLADEYDVHPGIVWQLVRRHWATFLVGHMDLIVSTRRAG